jgi:c-di-GMP-related signal transduction protein
MTKVSLARQPILDRDQSVEGYELLYPGADAETTVNGEALATARIALGALSGIGLEQVVGQRRAWINVPPAFLSPDLVRNLPP